nr:hypothetical protein CFP56_57039 [Quercus suber]
MDQGVGVAKVVEELVAYGGLWSALVLTGGKCAKHATNLDLCLDGHRGPARRRRAAQSAHSSCPVDRRHSSVYIFSAAVVARRAQAADCRVVMSASKDMGCADSLSRDWERRTYFGVGGGESIDGRRLASTGLADEGDERVSRHEATRRERESAEECDPVRILRLRLETGPCTEAAQEHKRRSKHRCTTAPRCPRKWPHMRVRPGARRETAGDCRAERQAIDSQGFGSQGGSVQGWLDDGHLQDLMYDT